MKKLTELNGLKKELKTLKNREVKVIESYKKVAIQAIELGGIEVVSKKVLRETITEVLSGLSENYIKKIRGAIINYFEGIRKYPQKKELILLGIENISDVRDFIQLSRNFKNDGDNVVKKSSNKSSNKSKVKIDVENISDKNAYFKIISSIIKIDENDFFNLEDDKIIALFEEVEKIGNILGKIIG